MKAIKSKILKISALVIIISLQSCGPSLLLNSNTVVEYDEVKEITRFKKTFFYPFAEEWNSSFIKNEQHIIKETKTFRDEYKIYDYMYLGSRLNSIEDTIYFIIDKKIYPINISFQAIENFSNIAKEEADILLSDSTKLSVITDYEIENYKVISLQYALDEDIITKMTKAKDIKIRYYSPPEMITLELSRLKIKAFKALIGSDQKADNKPRFYLN